MAGNFMNTMSRFFNMGNDEEYDDDYEEYDNDEGYEEETERKPLFGRRARVEEDDFEPEEKPARRSSAKSQSKITSMHPKKGSNNMELCVIKPTSFDQDGRRITDTLRSNCTVVLNLEGIDIDLAQRIIDFASGSCYAIDGNFRAISKSIILITPHQVQINGDFMEQVNGSLNITNLDF